jgi:hypothetical protein
MEGQLGEFEAGQVDDWKRETSDGRPRGDAPTTGCHRRSEWELERRHDEQNTDDD